MRTLLIRSVPVLVVCAVLGLPGTSAAQARNRDANDSGGGTSQAVPRGSVAAPAPAPAPAPPSQPSGSNAGSAPAGARTAPRNSAPADNDSRSSGEGARPREGRATVGTAVPRGSVARPPRPNYPVVAPPIYYGNYWPWGFGGIGFGGYYGSFYGGYYDPFYSVYGSYGGYGYPGYGYPGSAYPAYGSSYALGVEGSLRLKIKPRDAQVFVDGYYAGVVDDFDGVFQRLHVEAGPHRIEVRAPGFESRTFDVHVRPDDTTDLEAQLQRLP
jgi:hypothetical protein